MYARNVLLDALDDALDELPEKQREVFVAHELMGRSFKEIAEETGVSVNTLLSRKTICGAASARAAAGVEEILGKYEEKTMRGIVCGRF